MGSESRGDRIGLPDVHFGAAGAVLAHAAVGIGSRPADGVGLAIDELDVVRALGVAVTGPELCPGGVSSERGTSVSRHLGEVQGAVEAAGQRRHVDREGELPVLQLEHLVAAGIIGVEQVMPAAHVGAILVLCDESQIQGAWIPINAVGSGQAGPVNTLDCAVGGASGWIGAEGCIPGVAGVAILIAPCLVGPSPIRVQGRGRGLGDALPRGGACGYRHRLDVVRHLHAGLLSLRGHGEQSQPCCYQQSEGDSGRQMFHRNDETCVRAAAEWCPYFQGRSGTMC